MAGNAAITTVCDPAESGQTGTTALRNRSTIILYSIVVVLYWMSQYIYVASLPSYVQTKTSSLASVGLILSMYGLLQAIVRVPVGIVADWIGWRKPFILSGLILTGMGAWILGTSESANGLLVGRAITGLAAGAWVPMVVAFSSLFPPGESVRAAGYLILFQASGRIVASAANGPLNNLGGYQLAFYVAIGIALLSFLFAGGIREQRRPPLRPSMNLIGRLAVRRDVLLPSVLSALSQSITWGISLSFIPIVAKQLGGTDNTQSILAALAVVMLALGSLSANAITNRLGPRRVVMLSFLLFFIGGILAALARSIPALIASQTCLGLALGYTFPTLMGLSIRKVIDSERTIAMGIHQTVYAVGMFAGPAWSGMLADAIGIDRMFAATAFLALALGCLGARWLDER
jgi:MFS family permease